MPLPKQIEPRHQQRTGERRLDADPKQALPLLGNDLRQPTIDVVEADSQLLEQRLAGLGQDDTAMLAFEQWPADKALEVADLAADRGLRDEQLLRGAAEAQKPPGCLEASQRRQRKPSALHLHNLKSFELDAKLV